MDIAVIKPVYEVTPIILPTVCHEKARAFFEFRSGYYVAGEGYIPYQLMAIMVDEVSLDTVAYFDFVKTKGSSMARYVVSMRYEIIAGRFVQTWRSKEKYLFYADYLQVQARASQHLQEVARLCSF